MRERRNLSRRLDEALRHNPAVVLLGPRQCGKTTIARMIAASRKAAYFDLENPADLELLSRPALTLEPLRSLVIIDEIQVRPELYSYLRVLVDRPKTPARFLLLGSASPGLVKGVSQSLAGRVALIEMGGFDLRETGKDAWERLWIRGGFPRSWLAKNEALSFSWRNDFIKTFLERDLPQLGISIPAVTLRRFWTMLAHYHGQVWNAADFARSLGSAESTARRYLDLLAGAFVVRQLPPWFENLGKRQVRSPKIYIRDSGLLHALLALANRRDLLSHPKLGASWEGFALEETLRLHGAENAYFWATHAGAELDLMIFEHGRRIGYEFKCMDAPGMTRSLHVALHDLNLARAFIVYPGKRRYRVHPKVEVLPISELE
jgi:hypothetical protein